MQLARHHQEQHMQQLRQQQQSPKGQEAPEGDTDQTNTSTLPDMCMVETYPIRRILNENPTSGGEEESGGEGDPARQVQTSFITFKPQNVTLPPCQGCKSPPAQALKRADKSSSNLPHYGRLTRAGCIGTLDDCDNRTKTLPLEKWGPTPGCVECARDWNSNKELSTLEQDNKSV